MKCIFKMNTFASNTLSKSEYWTEDKVGNREPLLQRKHGFNTILTISSEGFTLCNGEGEVLRRGGNRDVFSIVDSMRFNPQPLYVKDNVKGVEMSYEDYELKYGVGRVEREELTKWLVYSEDPDEGATGTSFGLVRYDRFNTYEIHSIYMPSQLSQKQRTSYIANYILRQLNANEFASVNACNFSNNFDVPGVRIYGNKYSHTHEQAKLLHADAIERKASVSEIFPEPITYKAQKLFEEASKVVAS